MLVQDLISLTSWREPGFKGLAHPARTDRPNPLDAELDKTEHGNKPQVQLGLR